MFACLLLVALLKCLKAVSPSPPTPHTMYWSLSGSRVRSHSSSAWEMTSIVVQKVMLCLITCGEQDREGEKRERERGVGWRGKEMGGEECGASIEGV